MPEAGATGDRWRWFFQGGLCGTGQAAGRQRGAICFGSGRRQCAFAPELGPCLPVADAQRRGHEFHSFQTDGLSAFGQAGAGRRGCAQRHGQGYFRSAVRMAGGAGKCSRFGHEDGRSCGAAASGFGSDGTARTRVWPRPFLQGGGSPKLANVILGARANQ